MGRELIKSKAHLPFCYFLIICLREYSHSLSLSLYRENDRRKPRDDLAYKRKMDYANFYPPWISIKIVSSKSLYFMGNICLDLDSLQLKPKAFR